MSNPNALFLLADHVKLSLLERQRARTLNLESDSQDGHVSRSLDQFRDGLEALRTEQGRLEAAGEEDKAADIADALPALQQQLDDLTSQFHGFSTAASPATLARPNDPALAADFAHATTAPAGAAAKTVRFQDAPAARSSGSLDLETRRQAADLFNRPYRDEEEGAADAPEGYRDAAGALQDNTQIHAYHSRILEQQDEHLDRLGESIGRQRELSLRIGDELDEHVAMLDESEGLVDRHQSRLDRARRQVGRIARGGSGEMRQMAAIVLLIIILILLIAILK